MKKLFFTVAVVICFFCTSKGQVFNNENTFLYHHDSVDTLYAKKAVVSVSNESAANVELYPNPAKGHVFLRCNKPSKGELIFRNIIGQEVKKVKFNEQNTTLRISLSNLVSGVYLYSIVEDTETVVTSKIVVTK